MTAARAGTERRRGCIVLVGLLLTFVAAVAVFLLATASSWSPSPRPLEIRHGASGKAAVDVGDPILPPIDLTLDLSSVQLVVRPDLDLAGLVVSSEHDPSRYDLTVDEDQGHPLELPTAGLSFRATPSASPKAANRQFEASRAALEAAEPAVRRVRGRRRRSLTGSH